MSVYRIADLTVDIRSHYDYVPQQCRAYLAEEGAVPDFAIDIPEEEIDASIQDAVQYNAGDVAAYSRGYHESLCVYRRFCTEALHYGAFLMHAAVIAVKGRAYAFSAPSGTGKSTHISLWRQAFGKAVSIVNGDKPILRRTGDAFVAYGTPWCGKEGWQNNTKAPLAAICFLERSPENHIHRMSNDEAVDRVFHQLLRPRTRKEMEITLSLTDTLLRNVPLYLLGCNISKEAAVLAYRTMTNEEPEVIL